jgi:hypothetical protein
MLIVDKVGAREVLGVKPGKRGEVATGSSKSARGSKTVGVHVNGLKVEVASGRRRGPGPSAKQARPPPWLAGRAAEFESGLRAARH